MADEEDSHAAWSVVVEVAVEAAGAEVAFEFSAEEGGGLAAAGVAGALGAEEDEVGVGVGAGGEEGWGEGE